MVRDGLNFNIGLPGIIPLITKTMALDFAGTNMPATDSPTETLEDDGATASKPVILGEWMQLSSSGTKITRGGLAVAASIAAYDVPKFPIWSENGRFDEQGRGVRTVIYQGVFEADTKVILTGDTGTSSGQFGHADILGKRVVVVQGLKYGDASYAKYSVLGLKDIDPTAGLGMTVGYIIKPWDSTTGYLKVYCQAGGWGCYA